ncbi:hypothetical protein D6851_07490 [Altericroceibacterium spongiae]|uniref:DUF2231 domain-containing protein n=1 Tax=Altericroceibacterium spongiae TaxID=2320269 RepID=A0A420EMJ4_9SPHN|nr:DUF2231 domain-containing protein [Altericroceibacterium spongiae]RKF21851.1 hypothetical protein D6851_07490 [Altericroceibacterium spongiae]
MAIPPAHARPMLHPLHAILLAFPLALFTAALLSDITYLNTAQIQWTNFSSWLIAGAELTGALVVLWALIALIRHRKGAASLRYLLYLAVVAVMWIAGLINAFQHSHDAWSSVGTFGLILSILSAILAWCAGLIGYSSYPLREVS